MPDRSLGSQLGQMALALVNATLLLAVLLVFGLWLLIGRAQDFATDTARAAAEAVGSEAQGRIAERAASLDEAMTRLASLESRVTEAIDRSGTADGPAAAELAGLRTDVQALTAAVAGLTATATALRDAPADAIGAALQQILQDLAARLAPDAPAPSPT
jgi:Tfp pilus assembly protein PilO